MKRWGKAILILSLIVVWGGGLLPKHAEWRNLQYRLSFRDGRFAFGEQFDDAYGEVGVGPSLDLPEGEYVLTLQTDADAENEVVFSTENDAKIEPERIHTMIPGMLILRHMVQGFGAGRVIVSQYGVREGYLCQKILKAS